MPRQSAAAVIAAYRRFGLTVQVVPGAESRGNVSFNPGGHVGHHTAGPKTGDRPSLQVVVDGRSDLEGPLANDFLARSGVVYLVATGRANHAGLGGFRGITGNSGVSGTEAEDDGDGVWTDDQVWAYPRVVAARLWLIGRDASWYCSHRTWALIPPSWPGRKVDPAGIADEWMRARVSPLLTGNLTPPEDPMPDPSDLWSYQITDPATGAKRSAGELLLATSKIAADVERRDRAALQQTLGGTMDRVVQILTAVGDDEANADARAARILGRLDALQLDLAPDQVAQLAAALDLDEGQVARAVRAELADALAQADAPAPAV